MTGEDGYEFARFAFESNDLNRDRVHHALFRHRDGELSVDLIDERLCEELISTGQMVGQKRGKSLLGWAIVTRPNIEKEQLTVVVDNQCHDGHATIRGWPKDKNVCLDVRKALAKDAVPKLL